MKSNIFDFNRFGLLVRKRFLDGKSSTLYEIAGLAGVIAIIFGLVATTGSVSEEAQKILFTVGIFTLGIIYADRAFAEAKGKQRGMAFLATPASQLEKLLNAILYTSVLFPIAYLLIFLAVDGLFYLGINATGLVRMDAISVLDTDRFADFLLPFLIVQSVYLLGSIWFGKRSIMKTTFAIMLFFGVISAVGGFIIRMNFEELRAISSSGHDVNLNLGPEAYERLSLEYLSWLIPPFFWVVTYFRLSEKQI